MKIHGVKVTRSSMWSDGEFLCQLAADGLDALASRLRRLGGRCYSRGMDAKRRREEREATR